MAVFTPKEAGRSYGTRTLDVPSCKMEVVAWSLVSGTPEPR
uniref:Uncharacterized protein n=1 Tax=Arundo donax TaxID=35708 RepID=A0A0A9HCJ2_ARUDO